MNVGLGLSWRWSFFDASILAVVLCFLAACVRYPSHVEKSHTRIPVKKILSHRKVIIAALFILFSVAVDIGFSYWLAEYFAGSLGVQLKFASAAVSIYLAGIITGRLSTPFFLKFAQPLRILQISLSFSLLVLVFFLFVPSTVFKAVSVFFYGLGVGPLFPLMLSKGTEDYSGQSGSVSGILFSFMSVGGMTFPFLFGAIAQLYSIRTTYFVLMLIMICLIVSISIWKQRPSSSRES